MSLFSETSRRWFRRSRQCTTALSYGLGCVVSLGNPDRQDLKHSSRCFVHRAAVLSLKEIAMMPVFGFIRDLPASIKAVEWIQSKYGIEYDPVNAYMNESDFLISWSLLSLTPLSRQKTPLCTFTAQPCLPTLIWTLSSQLTRTVFLYQKVPQRKAQR